MERSTKGSRSVVVASESGVLAAVDPRSGNLGEISSNSLTYIGLTIIDGPRNVHVIMAYLELYRQGCIQDGGGGGALAFLEMGGNILIDGMSSLCRL